MAGAIPAVIDQPWKGLKAEHFDGENVALHASDLRNPAPEQISAIGNFFRFQEFGRFAVTATGMSKLPSHLETHQIISASMKRRWEELAARMNPTPTEVAFFFEASERSDELIQRFFSGIDVKIDERSIPVHYGLMEKSSQHPVLEVADFIVHAAGRQTFNWDAGRNRIRKDFEAVFHANPLWSSFHAITEVVPHA